MLSNYQGSGNYFQEDFQMFGSRDESVPLLKLILKPSEVRMSGFLIVVSFQTIYIVYLFLSFY